MTKYISRQLHPSPVRLFVYQSLPCEDSMKHMRKIILALAVLAAGGVGACSDSGSPTQVSPRAGSRSILKDSVQFRADGDSLPPPPPGDFECNGTGTMGSGGKACP